MSRKNGVAPRSLAGVKAKEPSHVQAAQLICTEGRYQDFGPTLMPEQLQKQGLVVA